MEENTVTIHQSFPENKSGYAVYEIEVDNRRYFAARSNQGTWKVCKEVEVNSSSRNIPVWIRGRNCGIHLISLLERMILAKTTEWRGPLPKILRGPNLPGKE